MKNIFTIAVIFLSLSTAAYSQTSGGGGQTGGGSSTPSGPAGGDLKGTYPDPTVGKATNTTASTTSSPAFAVVDNEANQSTPQIINIFAPNLTGGNHIRGNYGHDIGTRNSIFLDFAYSSNGSTNNSLQIGLQGLSGPSISLAATGDVIIGGNVDNNYKFDVVGSARAQQYVGSGTAPSIVAGAGAGTTPTAVSVAGTASAFTANLTTGTTPATSSVIATVTFTAYTAAPHVVCQAKNAATANATINFFVTTTTTTAVLNAGIAALSATTPYSWDCITVQ